MTLCAACDLEALEGSAFCAFHDELADHDTDVSDFGDFLSVVDQSPDARTFTLEKPESVSARRQRYLENRDRELAVARSYYERNKARIAAVKAANYQRKKKEYSERHKAWRKANRDKQNAYQRKYRARRRAA